MTRMSYTRAGKDVREYLVGGDAGTNQPISSDISDIAYRQVP